MRTNQARGGNLREKGNQKRGHENERSGKNNLQRKVEAKVGKGGTVNSILGSRRTIGEGREHPHEGRGLA